MDGGGSCDRGFRIDFLSLVIVLYLFTHHAASGVLWCSLVLLVFNYPVSAVTIFYRAFPGLSRALVGNCRTEKWLFGIVLETKQTPVLLSTHRVWNHSYGRHRGMGARTPSFAKSLVYSSPLRDMHSVYLQRSFRSLR